jgi:hypothetical protein
MAINNYTLAELKKGIRMLKRDNADVLLTNYTTKTQAFKKLTDMGFNFDLLTSKAPTKKQEKYNTKVLKSQQKKIIGPVPMIKRRKEKDPEFEAMKAVKKQEREAKKQAREAKKQTMYNKKVLKSQQKKIIGPVPMVKRLNDNELLEKINKQLRRPDITTKQVASLKKRQIKLEEKALARQEKNKTKLAKEGKNIASRALDRLGSYGFNTALNPAAGSYAKFKAEGR